MKKLFTGLKFHFLILILLPSSVIQAQEKGWSFAHVSDIHIGDPTSVADLERTVNDINQNRDLEFVIVSGDITEFGADAELRQARSILEKINKPWYVIPGNHDTKWSESGGETFKRVFGTETFEFKSHGFLFIGTNSGPNMRMSPGQVPRENIVWLDSVLNKTPKTTPIIFVNHYPIDSSLNNWYEIIDKLKAHHIQLIICGHGHSNHQLNFEGIPGIMGRSNLRANDSIGGYNIVTIRNDSVFYQERNPLLLTKPTWAKLSLYTHHFKTNTTFARPSYQVNQQYPIIKEVWTVHDEWDIGSGSCITDNKFIVGNTGGWIKAYRLRDGKLLWQVKTEGKIYSTPVVYKKSVIVPSTDGHIYCLNTTSGKLQWKNDIGKPIVASPAIKDGYVFCGGSDGHFRCYDIQTGLLKWDFDQVKGFVETKPLIHGNQIYFGTWANKFYSLFLQTGQLAWLWDDGSTNRMYSPAACYPVATHNKLFIVAPDRYMTCLDAKDGHVVWRKFDPKVRVRESMGLSEDSALVYVKTMDGDVLGVSTQSDEMIINWRAQKSMGYDISPSPIVEHHQLVFYLSNSGEIDAFNRFDGSLKWTHKLSNCLVNPLSFLKGNRLISTTMDGRITCLKY